MAKKKAAAEIDKHDDTKELDTDMYFTPQSGIKLQWVIVVGVMLAVFTLLVAWPRSKSEPAAAAAIEPSAPMAVAEGAAPEADASAAALHEPPPPPPLNEEPAMPIPEPVTMENSAAGPDDGGAAGVGGGDDSSSAAEESEPVAAPVRAAAPRKVVAAPKAKTVAKKHVLVLNAAGTKIPAGLQKKNIMALLTKKLNMDSSCLPASMKAQDLKSFTAVVAVSKAGAVTSVDLKPKNFAQAKAVSACIRRKLAGNPATFKSKGAAKIQVSFRMK